MMTCIPAAMVQADWGAIATGVGALISAGVVASAFEVQKRQWKNEATREAAGRRDVTMQSSEAVVGAILALRLVRPQMESDAPFAGAVAASQHLEEQDNILEYYLQRGLPQIKSVRLLMAVRAEVRDCRKWLSKIGPQDSETTLSPKSIVKLTNAGEARWPELMVLATQLLHDLPPIDLKSRRRA